MSKNVDFEVGTIVTDAFLDSLQEVLTGSINNLRLDESGLGTDRVALSLSGDIVNDMRGAVNVGGRYCYTDMTKDSSPASAGNGTKDIYLDTSTSEDPDFNVTVGTAPAASYIRKLGTAERTGAQLHNVRMNNGVQADADQYNAFIFRSVMDYDDETIISIQGQSAQLSPADTNAVDPSASPTKALSVGENGNDHLYIDTLGRIVFPNNGGDGDVALQYRVFSGDSAVSLNRSLRVERAGAGDSALSIRTTANTFNRFNIGANGTLSWGSGAAALDANISRSAPNILTLGAGDKLQQNEAPTVGDDLTNKTYVDSVAGAGVAPTVTSVVANYAASPLINQSIFCNTTGGAITVTLPAGHSSGEVVVVKDSGGSAGTNYITINPAGAETIDGITSHVIFGNYESVTFQSDGTDWYLI